MILPPIRLPDGQTRVGLLRGNVSVLVAFGRERWTVPFRAFPEGVTRFGPDDAPFAYVDIGPGRTRAVVAYTDAPPVIQFGDDRRFTNERGNSLDHSFSRVETLTAPPDADAGGARWWVVFKSRTPLPASFGLRAEGFVDPRRVVVPFALRDVDLAAPPPVPDLRALPPVRFRDADGRNVQPPAPEKTDGPPAADEIPAVRADAPIPAAILKSRYTGLALSMKDAARRGMDNDFLNRLNLDAALFDASQGDATGAWEVVVYATALPSGAFKALSATVDEIQLRDGTRVAIPRPEARDVYFGNASGGPRYARHGGDAADDDVFETRAVPFVAAFFPPWPLPYDPTALSLIRGTFDVLACDPTPRRLIGALATEKDAVAVCEAELPPSTAMAPPDIDGAGAARPVPLTARFAWRDDAGMRAGFVLDIDAEAFAGLELHDADPDNPWPAHQIHRTDAKKDRVEVDVQFAQKPPARLRVTVLERASLRVIRVPFEIRDPDLATPSPLP